MALEACGKEGGKGREGGAPMQAASRAFLSSSLSISTSIFLLQFLCLGFSLPFAGLNKKAPMRHGTLRNPSYLELRTKLNET